MKVCYSLGLCSEQLLHRSTLVVFQQREVEAVLVRAGAACALIQELDLHQRAVGVVEDDKAFGAGRQTGKDM